MTLILHGYRYSVYTWIARMALRLRGLDWTDAAQDPFADPEALRPLHPFARVPVLDHDGFRLYETAAILRFLARFPGPPLVPDAPRAEARMTQVQGIVDAYGYRPLVRQVFSHAVFRPAAGEPADPAIVAQGLAASTPVLAALDSIAAEGLVLNGTLSLADLHLAPMIAYFTAAPEAAAGLARFPALAAWWARIREHPALRATDPGLPEPSPAVPQAKTP